MSFIYLQSYTAIVLVNTNNKCSIILLREMRSYPCVPAKFARHLTRPHIPQNDGFIRAAGAQLTVVIRTAKKGKANQTW